MKSLRNLHGFGAFLEDEEQVVYVFRTEWSYMLSHLCAWGLIFWGWAWVVFFFYPRQLAWLWLGLLVVGAARMMGTVLWWYYNAIIVSNMNLLFIHWEKPLEKSITRVDYWNLDEIQVVKKGLGAFMYHYGTLVFTKLSGGDPIAFDHVKHPNSVAIKIDDYKESMVHQRNFSQDAGVKDLLIGLIGRHVDEHGVPQPEKLVDKRVPRNRAERGLDHIRTTLTDFMPWKTTAAEPVAEMEKEDEKVPIMQAVPVVPEAPVPIPRTPLPSATTVKITQTGRLDDTHFSSTDMTHE